MSNTLDTTKYLLNRLENLVRYHDDDQWKRKKEAHASEITDGYCSYLDVLLQEARNTIIDAKRFIEEEEKAIYVTIGEFLKNGGYLTKGREIFSKNTDGKFMKTGTYLRKENDLLIVKAPTASFPVSTVCFYVKVTVVPIYR